MEKRSSQRIRSLILLLLSDRLTSKGLGIEERNLLSDPVFWEIARENKVSYALASKLESFAEATRLAEVSSMIEESTRSFRELRSTLAFVSRLFSNEDMKFMVIKTFKGIYFPTEDIDILVRAEDYSRATRILVRAGASTFDRRFRAFQVLGLGEPDFSLSLPLKVDVYSGLPWRNFNAISEDFLWESVRQVNIAGITCEAPNPEADVLVLLASALFTDRKLTLADMLYFGSLYENGLDLSRMLEETSSKGWDKGFKVLNSTVLHYSRLISSDPEIGRVPPLPYHIPFYVLARVMHRTLIRSSTPFRIPQGVGNLLFRSVFSPSYIRLRQFF